MLIQASFRSEDRIVGESDSEVSNQRLNLRLRITSFSRKLRGSRDLPRSQEILDAVRQASRKRTAGRGSLSGQRLFGLIYKGPLPLTDHLKQ